MTRHPGAAWLPPGGPAFREGDMTPDDLERMAKERGGTVVGVNAAAFTTGPEPKLPPPASEAEFQCRVIDFARSLGYLVAHFRPVRVQRQDGSVYYETPAQADGAGFPDLVVAGHGRLLVWELKVHPNKPTEAQQRWLDALTGAGVEAAVCYPEDWPMMRMNLEDYAEGKSPCP